MFIAGQRGDWNVSREERHSRPRGHAIYEMVGAGIGAALGWLLAPHGDQRLGLAIGAGVGALLGSVWKLWWLKRRSLTEAASGLGWGGHAFYFVAIALCLSALWFPVKTWVQYPDKWLAAVAGLLFFGAGAVLLVLLWRADRGVVSIRASDARWAIMSGIACFVLALASVLLAVLGHLLVGVVGALACGLCGIMAIRRGRSMMR